MSKVSWIIDRPWFAQLDMIKRECARPNWDSYGAKPVSPHALREAWLILKSWPASGDERPYPFPRVDGSIVLEWTDAREWTIQINPDGNAEWESDRDESLPLVLAQ